MNKDLIKAALRASYQWGRDNGNGRSEKNFNDFLETIIADEVLSDDENIEPTQGEWVKVEIDLADMKQISVGVKGGRVICHLYIEDNEITNTHIANANLISAAPDLLEALKNLLEDVDSEGWSDDDGNDWDVQLNARKAIKKALGK